jgi:GT2 family glycosyltransferase
VTGETMRPHEPAEWVESSTWAAALPAVSVIVPTHDRASLLPELIGALEHQGSADPFEVVVVDDASSDDTWRALNDIAAGTTLPFRAARLAANAGPAVARNVAASLARAPLLAFTDDDCLPARDWIEALAEGFRIGDIVQGRTLPYPPEAENAGPWARSVWITHPSNLFETCNLGVRKDAFDRLGGFGENRPSSPRGTRAHFGEDAALGWRLVAGGGRVTFAGGALIHHRVHPASYADWLAEQRRLAMFPGLVVRAPGMRRALTLGIFLSPDTALFDLTVAAAVAAIASGIPWIAVAGVPWAWRRWRQSRHRPGRARILRLGQLGLGDVVGLASLVEGSVRARTVVL